MCNMFPETPPTKFIIWGHEHYASTHSYIHYAFYKAALSMGWNAIWLANNESNANLIDKNDGYLFVTEGTEDSYIPINSNAFYILHNCNLDKYNRVNELQKIVLQVFTKDVYSRIIAPVKNNSYEFWQSNANTLYMPWATDILPDEIDKNIEDVKNGRQHKEHHALFLGTIWGGEFGNINEIRKFNEGCNNINLPFIINHSTKVNQSESIDMLKLALITPSIVGTWQKEKGYIPCRIFKTISYGQLGITNSEEAYKIANKLVIYSDNEAELPSMSLPHINNTELICNAMKNVRDNHTYVNRINSIQYIFMLKHGFA